MILFHHRYCRKLQIKFIITPPSIARALTVSAIVAVAGMGADSAQAQKNSVPPTNVIYTCTDAAGHKITSDRLIASCMDREQRVLSNQGLLLKIIAPEQTDEQRAAQQEKDRQAAAARQRQQEQQRFDEALLVRYPTREVHEASRRTALAQTRIVLADAQRHLAALEDQRTALAASQAATERPGDAAKLKHDIASNAQAIEAQKRFIAAYQATYNRINAQFDAQAQRLQPLWQNAQADQAAQAASSTNKQP